MTRVNAVQGEQLAGRRFLSRDEFVEKCCAMGLPITRKTLEKAAIVGKGGHPPYVKWGGKVRIPEDLGDAWIASRIHLQTSTSETAA